MAFVFLGRYEPEVEERMRGFYQTLNEKDARRFAALDVYRSVDCGQPIAIYRGIERIPIG